VDAIVSDAVRTTFYLARQSGQPVAALARLLSTAGLAEIAGVATVPWARRKGLGSWLTWLATSEALVAGVDEVILTAASAAAARMYQRIGYRSAGEAVSYIKTEAPASLIGSDAH
jgi:predicted GNAT family acetyltransferase